MKRNLQVAAFTLATAMFACLGAKAQSPGGVAPAVWYRADAAALYANAGTTAATNNGTVQQWNDAQGSGRNLIQNTASARPVFSSETTLSNFNPTVTFDGSNDFLQFTAGAGVNLINRANGSIFTAGRVNTLKQSGFAGFHASMDFPGLHVFGSNRKLLFFTGGPGYQGLSADAFAANTSFSAGSGWQNGSGSSASATVSFNGIRTDYTGSELRNVIVNDAYRDFRIGGDSNYGSFSGQLNEVLVYEDRLNADQMDRVETYLAIKYGTTYAKGTRDYKNAAGDVVWSASVNAGFGNNIAGIAVDNNGALSQKQSWSTNAGQQVLIGVGTLSATNAANGGTIANNQYLVWGDNGGAKVPTVATSAFAGVSHHFQSIWKVQNTGIGTVRVAWPKGFKGLSLVQSSDATIGAGDVITPMSGEATLNGMVYNYADVTLASGQYFTIAAKVPAPGGVTTGLTQWYRADQNLGSTGGNGTNITSWTDYTRGTVSGPISSAPVPVYKEGATNHFNFNPGVQFTSNRQMLGNISAQTLESTSFDIFTFTKEGLTGTRFFNVGRNNTTLNGTNWDSPGLNANGSVGTRDLNGGAGGTLNPGSVAFSATTPSIMYHTFTNTSIRKGLNGAALGTAWNVSARGQQTGGHIFGSNAGTNPPNGDDYGFVGHIGEVIVYGAGNLSATDRNKVDSYLALKYGITLPATVNYLDSDGDIVWNSSSNSTFHKNVAGIVHDEASALNQKQSISVNKGQQVLISTPGLANTNAANGTALADGQYVIWGDNGLSKSLTTSHNTIVSGNELNLRFAAVWKVANTGSAGVVRVAWPTGIVNLHLIQSNDATIDISDAHTRMNNTVSVNGVTYNYADVSLADGSYFSFGGFIAGPGGVGQDLSLWYRADSGVETDASNKVTGWNNSTAKDVKLQMSSASAYIPYNDQITKAWNFNPTLSFDGTNNYLRNTTTDYLTAGGAVHYITVARLTASASSYNSIFAISGNDDGFFLYPQSGLVYPMPAIGNGFGAAAAGPGSANRFGIYSAILPKTGTPANQRGFYNGLEKVYTAPYPLTGGWYSLPTRGAYIGADGTTGDNPKGDIAEVIVYHEPAGGDMTNANLAKIHSYLAVKYGVTLDQTTPQNYVNSGGNVVWNATTNIGYKNNIAGIARDDQGGLYQKQSGSVNPGAQVVIGTTGLANTNGSNAEPLSNGQFLIWGDNGLAKAPGVSFGTIAGLPYNRFAAIWKVENTSSVETVRVAWVKGYANLKLVQSPDATIDLSDAVTEMSSTITIGGKEYAYADVTLQNGTYFTFAAVVQGPGGVTTNLSQWYRADYYVESEGDGEDASSWADFNGGVVSTQLGEANLPTAKKGAFDYFNFNPGINFTGADQKLGNISLPTLSALNFDIFSVTKEGMSGTRFFNIGMDNTTFNGNNWDQPGLYANGNIARRTNTGSNAIIVNPGNVNFSTNTPSIMYHAFTDLSMSKGLNGAALPSSPYTHTARGAVTGGHFFGSNSGSGTSGDDGGFTGSIGELIIYGAGSVSPADRNKVDTYLAIKYGVTLAAGTNYTTSTSAVIWDATANTAYHNNIAGIGNDFRSALHQKQSRSQRNNDNNSARNQVVIGLGEIAATNSDNNNALTDGQFLVWGDNGLLTPMNGNTASTFTTISYGGGTSNGRRVNRVWKVQNTGMPSELQVVYAKAAVGTTTLPTADICADYVILFSSDPTFTSNVTALPLTSSEDNLNYEALTTFPDGVSYFTYAKVTPITTGTVYLPEVTEETTQYIDNCATTAWTYFRNSADASLKLFATTGLTTTVLSNLTVTITPEGVNYEEGGKQTNLMPRITTVTNALGGTFPAAKVRIYYSTAEQAATNISGAQTNGWFKYEGPAEDVVANVYATGSLDGTKAVALTPSATGVENGVNYVEFDNITSFSSFVYLSSTESALPVTLTYFNARKEANVASLTWGTTEEVNNAGFEIQRSANARDWNAIGFVENQTAGGNSKGALSYNFADVTPLKGTNYYRLKQIDTDGSYLLSSIVSVRFENGKDKLFVYPNPVVNGKLTLSLPETGLYTLRVYNVSGVEVLNVKQAESTVDVSKLATGMYVMKVTYANGETHNKSFVVK